MKLMYVLMNDNTGNAHVKVGPINPSANPVEQAQSLAQSYMNNLYSREAVIGTDYQVIRFDYAEVQTTEEMETIYVPKDPHEKATVLRGYIKDYEIECIGLAFHNFLATKNPETGKTGYEVLKENNLEAPSEFDYQTGSEYNDNDYDTVIESVTLYDKNANEFPSDALFEHPDNWHDEGCSLEEVFKYILDYEIGVSTLEAYIGSYTRAEIKYPVGAGV